MLWLHMVHYHCLRQLVGLELSNIWQQHARQMPLGIISNSFKHMPCARLVVVDSYACSMVGAASTRWLGAQLHICAWHSPCLR
jgi:hypothetical protein